MKIMSLLLFFLPSVIHAQRHDASGLAADSAGTAFAGAIEAVLYDFPDNLRHITGDLVLAQGEFENYASMVVLPGSENCTVTRYHSMEDSTVSWQAVMFRDESFTKASRRYGELYGKLKNCYLRRPDGSVDYLKGVWEPAKEEISFTTSSLRLGSGDPKYREVKVELELLYQVSDWVIHINVVSKKPDDEIGGVSPATPLP